MVLEDGSEPLPPAVLPPLVPDPLDVDEPLVGTIVHGRPVPVTPLFEVGSLPDVHQLAM